MSAQVLDITASTDCIHYLAFRDLLPIDMRRKIVARSMHASMQREEMRPLEAVIDKPRAFPDQTALLCLPVAPDSGFLDESDTIQAAGHQPTAIHGSAVNDLSTSGDCRPQVFEGSDCDPECLRAQENPTSPSLHHSNRIKWVSALTTFQVQMIIIVPLAAAVWWLSTCAMHEKYSSS
jgi:hypothetical protein